MKNICFLIGLVTFMLLGLSAYTQCSVEFEKDSLGIVCGGLVQLNALTGWTPLNPIANKKELFSIFFINPDTGWVGGSSGTLIKTTDGGASWTKQNTPNTDYIKSIHFVTADTGYATIGNGLMKTTDGGINWQFINVNAGLCSFISVYFANSTTGYCICESGYCYKTTDGGINWIALPKIPIYVQDVQFLSADTAFICGSDHSIFKTTNGGIKWDTLLYEEDSMWFQTMCFINSSTGFTACPQTDLMKGYLFKTSDGGKNWTKSVFSNVINSVFFINSTTGYLIVGPGIIYKTTNAGANWSLVKKIGQYIHTIYFYSENNGFILGSPNIMYKLAPIDSFKWSTSNNLNNVNTLTPIASPDSTSTYVITTYTKSCIAKDTATVYVHPMTVSTTEVYPDCGDSAVLFTSTNYEGKGTLTYTWSPSEGLDDIHSDKPIARITSNKTYYVNLISSDGCQANNEVNVYFKFPDKQEICIVGVNESNKNIIIWEKPTSISIDSFYIHRETDITNNYIKIGAVSYKDMSTFTDTLSHPTVQSNKYLITVKDICLNESAQSEPHKTMHLTINQGMGSVWNLIWEPYQGFNVSTYKVYRGTSSDNLQQIGSTSSSATQFTDNNPPAGYVYYQVEVISPHQCTPTRSINSSRSNIATNNPVGIKEDKASKDLFSVYPNPAKDKISITSNSILSRKIGVCIYNVQGKQIIDTQFYDQNNMVLDISKLSMGIYYIKVQTEKEVEVKIFIKQ